MSKILSLLIFIPLFFLFCCGSHKTRTVVIFHGNNKFFTAGEPHVNYHSNGASLDYFIPGAIIVFRADQTFLKQKCKAGKVYQIDKDTVLYEIGKIDTTLSDTAIANQFLVYDIGTDTE